MGEDVRQKFADAALAVAGLGYGKETRLQYLDFIAPAAIDPEELRDAMGRMWSNALTVLALWRRVGVQHKLLEAAYRPGRTSEWIETIGMYFDAIRYPVMRQVPGIGDAVEVDAGQHIIAAIAEREACFVTTVEGGQVDALGYKCIQRFRDKKIAYINGALYIGSSRVVRWYDCTALLPASSSA